MKSLVRLVVFFLLSEPAVYLAQGGFSSLYVYGDGVSTTTGSPDPPSYYYGNRYCNGRVWVEVLAQRQGVAYDANKNVSALWHTSDKLVNDANQFSAVDATNSLFVIWVSDADFAWDMSYIYPSLDPSTWNNRINTSLAYHSQAIQTLYNKGARTLIMPNAVEITAVPYYAGLLYYPADRNFIRQRVIDFNSGFSAVVNQARASLPGIRIIVPDFFSLLDNMLANPAYYGLVNPYFGAYALLDGYTSKESGPGINYVFWDYQDPTAKAHAIMADIAQQMLSPANITKVTALNGSNRLDAVNIPVGRNGSVEGRTNLVLGSWATVTNFNSTSVTQAIYVRSSGPRWFYRLTFPPFAWSWP